MVKIVNTIPTNKPQKDKTKIDNTPLQQLTTNQILNNPTIKEQTTQISIRLSNSILNQLNQYAKQQNTNKSNIVSELIKNKFNNKKITRDNFNLFDQQFLLLPVEQNLINHYAINKVNILSDIIELQNKYSVQPFTKQETIFNEFEQEFKIIPVEQINNILDTYDNTEKCFYSTYQLPEKSNIYKNHIGLIAINTPVTNIEKETTENKDILLFIHSYDNKIVSCKIINKKTCLKYAAECNNNLIIDYLKNNQEIIKIQSIKELHQKEHEQNNKIKELEQTIKEIQSNKKYTIDTTVLTALQQENNDLKKQLDDYFKTMEHLIKEYKKIE